jgi:hypothetical protein
MQLTVDFQYSDMSGQEVLLDTTSPRLYFNDHQFGCKLCWIQPLLGQSLDLLGEISARGWWPITTHSPAYSLGSAGEKVGTNKILPGICKIRPEFTL